MELADRTRKYTKFKIVPCQKICPKCIGLLETAIEHGKQQQEKEAAEEAVAAVNMSQDSVNNNVDIDTTYEPTQDEDKVAQAYELFNLSPPRKTDMIEDKDYRANKLQDIDQEILSNLGVLEDIENVSEENEIVKKIKDLAQDDLSKEVKAFIVQIMPSSWSVNDVVRNTGLSKRLVHDVRSGKFKLERKESSNKLSPEKIIQIREFYFEDRITRTMPGQNDVISVRQSDGKRKPERKELLQFTLEEAFKRYQAEYGEKDICFSTFYRHKPKNVVLVASTNAQNSCQCVKCDNPEMLIVTSILGEMKVFETLVNGKKVTAKELGNLMVCDDADDNCLFEENCGDCENLKLKLEKDLNDILKAQGIEEVNFIQWLFTDRDHKKSITLSSEDFCEKVVTDCFDLRRHHFLREKQDAAIKDLKSNLPKGHIMVYQDYAENYSVIHPNETQKV